MKRIAGFLWLCAMLFAAGAAQAQVDKATAESLLRKSGLWEQLASIPVQAEAGLADVFAKSGAKPSAAETDRVSRAIRTAYSATRLRSVALEIVSTRLNAQHVAELQRWYDSRIGQDVTRIEEQASAETGDPQAKMQQGFRLLERSPPARRQLLQDLLRETRAAELMTQMTINTSLAALRGLSSVMPEAPAVSLKELNARLETQRPQMMQTFSAVMLAGFARVYVSLPEDQLQQYVRFLASRAGNHYTAVCMEALEAGLMEAAADFGRRLPSTKDQANT